MVIKASTSALPMLKATIIIIHLESANWRLIFDEREKLEYPGKKEHWSKITVWNQALDVWWECTGQSATTLLPRKNSIKWERYDVFLKVDQCLFHFCRMSTRIISVYDSRNLSETLSTLEINVAPSVLIPFYDEDSAVLFLSSKVGIFTECKLWWTYLWYCTMQK